MPRRTRELTVDDVWQIADAGDQELQRLARNNRRGNLELGADDNALLNTSIITMSMAITVTNATFSFHLTRQFSTVATYQAKFLPIKP